MKWLSSTIFSISLFALSIIPRFASAGEHPEAPYTRKDLEAAKNRAESGRSPWVAARNNLLQEADDALKLSVTPAPAQLIIPRRYADSAGHMQAREKIGADAWAAQALALGTWMTDDQTKRITYAQKAMEILMAWTACEDMGSLTGEQREAALVSCTSGNGLIVAADLLSANPLWAKEHRERFQKWVSTVYLRATEIRTIGHGNNWECWGIYATLLASNLIEDKALFTNAANLLELNITEQISEDGSMPKELARGPGRHWYTYYALTPLILGAKVVEDSTGKKLLDPATPTGKRLASAVAYFLANLDSTPYRDMIEGYGGLTNNEACLRFNLAHRPVTGIRAHSGWNFPTLFLRAEVVPENHPPLIVITRLPTSAKAGEEIVLDASGSSDPDGHIRDFFWVYSATPSTTSFDNELRSATDIVDLGETLTADFTLAFSLKINRLTNAAIGLQSEADTGKDWNGSSFLVNTKDGLLKVRDGARYRADRNVPCRAGDTVKIRMEVRPLSQKCDVFVDSGNGEILLAKDCAIREDKKARTDVRRIRYVGEEGAKIEAIKLATSQRIVQGRIARLKFNSPGNQLIQLIAIDNMDGTATRQLPLTVVP